MDTDGYIYENDFIPVLPNIYLILSNESHDDSGGNYQFMFNITLQANGKYILVVTTQTSNTTGIFSIIATGPNLLNFSRLCIPSKNSAKHRLKIL
jgi:hypothetical protein